jgi:murein DD-endopeptidase MepM/ murein hydrolase activator NlpD
MAGPGAILAAKAVLTLATDKRTWKAVAVAVAAICMPLILVVVCILGMASATAHHNNAAVNLTFNGGNIPASMPGEYRTYITEMRSCFAALDTALAALDVEWEDGDLDMIRVKAVFYALFFGDDSLSLRKSEARAFLKCFYETETRTREVEDEDGNITEESYTAAIPITDLQTVYANVGSHIGRQLTPEDMANISEIYLRVTRGDFSVDSGNVPLEGGSNGTHALIDDLTAGDESPAPTGGYISPIDGDWRSVVSCEYGTGYAGHTGMDLAVPLGTPIYAVADGTVLFTRASSGGYGIHVAINHGGRVVTLYAHCSQLLVGEGQRVRQGEMIALSGSTGNSTGPHLHLEFVVSGQHQNPRNYLS